MPSTSQVVLATLAAAITIAGIAYSILLTRRAHQAIRKANDDIANARGAAGVAAAIARSTSVNLLMVRFVLLYIVLSATIYIGPIYRLALSLTFRQEYSSIGWFLRDIPDFANLLILLVLGWPIFVDANALVGIDLIALPSGRGTEPEIEPGGDALQ